VTTFNNYKTDQSYKETLPGSNDGCHTNWTDEACQRNCTSDKNGKFLSFGGVPGGANIGYEWDNCYQDCCAYRNNCVCICKMPNLNIFAANGRALETAKTIMDQAESDKIAKRRTATEYAQRQIPSPEINIACCTNSVTCGTDADCNKITQTCESKIDAMKSEKVATEKVATEKVATEKAATEKAETDNPSAQTGQKSTSSVNSLKTNSSPNNSLISSSIILCCCLLLIILLIILFN